MNKRVILEAILKRLDAIKLSAVKAANQAHETATHSETVAKSKYETFGLEASYLAHGQTQRVAQCAKDISDFAALTIRCFDRNTPIGLTALVVIMDECGTEQVLFLGPGAGGVKLSISSETTASLDGKEIMIVTPYSPLGRALLGRMPDDIVVINIAGNRKEFEIIAVY
ncbi:transcription elongation factor [uncultured Shewanella sp.]|uniref:transcription elongation factor n=1 Tax=Shewanella atlantica TaxID=271099 RepID=UPI0026343240|nr:transcription elongation factor [uncultured Shewanella sp.]